MAVVVPALIATTLLSHPLQITIIIIILTTIVIIIIPIPITLTTPSAATPSPTQSITQTPPLQFTVVRTTTAVLTIKKTRTTATVTILTTVRGIMIVRSLLLPVLVPAIMSTSNNGAKIDYHLSRQPLTIRPMPTTVSRTFEKQWLISITPPSQMKWPFWLRSARTCGSHAISR